MFANQPYFSYITHSAAVANKIKIKLHFHLSKRFIIFARISACSAQARAYANQSKTSK